jgi:hypothetical protein
MPSKPSWLWVEYTSEIVATVFFDPSDGFTRVTRLPVFSVTQRKPSAPQVNW